jgi:molybdopterin molybdotransferase
MTTPYTAGLAEVLDTARNQRNSRRDRQVDVPFQDAIGGIAVEDVLSPISIPEHDTSAMDGYAIRSQATATASPETPVMFRVTGTIAAGDDPGDILSAEPNAEHGHGLGTATCVEIMTGAMFPEGYDACVKLEDTVSVDGGHILVTKPVPPNANRRFAGSDIHKGEVILKRGDTVQPSHILPLASVGLGTIPMVRKPRVGIWSTGKEMVNGNGSTRDANGPYLTAAVREMGMHADFLGVLDDDPVSLRNHVEKAAMLEQYDVFVTSGAVSKSKFDYVRSVLDEMGAEVVFHGLAIRPGHPVLFAMVPGNERKTAFFGLPGNPGAAAACFRFLTVPYLRELQGQPREQPSLAKLLHRPDSPSDKHGCHAKQNMDCFRHGILSTSAAGQIIVEASAEQSPAKLGPFTTANCWIHFPPEPQATIPGPGGVHLVECYPISPTGAIRLSSSDPLLN